MTPTRRRRIAFHQFGPTPPSTVWPCAQDDLREGTALIANWLLTALAKIATTYTQPGQRVLLLTPSTMVRTGPYHGLFEAAWTVMRLGRSVHTHTAQPCPDGDYTIDSGIGLPADHGPDRFALIIAVAGQDAFRSCRLADWTRQLAATGTLAVITHGGPDHGHLADPAGDIVTAMRSAGLHYHDRIALLTVPVHDGVLAPTSDGHAPLGPSTRHNPAHHDLLVFTRSTAVPNTHRSATVGKEMADG